MSLTRPGAMSGEASRLEAILGRLELHARALVVLLLTRALLPRRGVTRTMLSVSERLTPPLVKQPAPRIVRAVRRVGYVAARHDGCLPQSVTVAALLHAQNEAPDLVLGCLRGQDSWTAHAWVEVNGLRCEPVRGGAHTTLARCNANQGWRFVAPL